MEERWERTCKHMRVPVEKEWTEDHQSKLEKLQRGDISQELKIPYCSRERMQENVLF